MVSAESFISPTKSEMAPFGPVELPFMARIREDSRFDGLLKKSPLRATRGRKTASGKLAWPETLAVCQFYQNTDDFRTVLFHLMKRTDIHGKQ
jgi:hypothetical protein